MSSPLSMLKKTKRIPLQGPLIPQGGGGRRESLKGGLSTGRLSAVTTHQHGGHHEYGTTEAVDDSPDVQRPPVPHAQPTETVSTSTLKASLKKGITPPTDPELMSSMIKCLTQLEIKVKGQAEEIERKEKKISVLEGKLKRLQKSERASDADDKDDLVRTCHRLQTQVSEMERFLSDYGMTWVGSGETCDTACQQEGVKHTQTQSPEKDTCMDTNFHVNFDLVLQNIKELNIVAGEGECFVKATAKGAQLAKKDPIQLRLYRNGILMFDGPFRSYQEHSTQRCMQDLMDGYFPLELQERFPDGVPFEVHDRRDEDFSVRWPWSKFPGKGLSVDGATDKALFSNTFPSQIPGRKLTMDQFLSRLPKVVVKAGQVIDIRNSLRATLQGLSDDQKNSSVTLIDTPALHAVKEILQVCDSDQPPSIPDVTTLRVRSENGDHNYMLKMHFSETIGHLRQYLDTHRGTHLSGYDIISVLPKRCYDDDCEDLLSCGLTPSATLLLQTTHSKREPIPPS